MKEILVKVASVLIALLLFWYVRSDANTSYIEVHPPIELKGLADGKTAIINHSRQIRLTLKGPSSVLSKFAVTPPMVRFQIPEGTPNGAISLPIESDSISLPPFVAVVSHVPDSLEVEIDDVMEKEVPIIASFEGKFLPTVRLKNTAVTPPKVLIRGPAKKIKTIESVTTTPISRETIDASMEREVFLKLPLDEIEAMPNKVFVGITIEVVRK